MTRYIAAPGDLVRFSHEYASEYGGERFYIYTSVDPRDYEKVGEASPNELAVVLSIEVIDGSEFQVKVVASCGVGWAYVNWLQPVIRR